MKKSSKTTYHHGNLREALLEAALSLLREQGPAEISLREVARRAQVSHAAPAHHFGDKAGLLTALATRGFELFGEAMRSAAQRGSGDAQRAFAWAGWAYVMFAAEHRAYFEIMFSPELLHAEDPALLQASGAAYQVLIDSVKSVTDPTRSPEEEERLAIQAWSWVHGLATLWLHGNLKKYGTHAQLDGLVKKLCGLE